MGTNIFRAVNSTLIYLERGDEYLMLHRTKKENDLNHDKWIGVGGAVLRVTGEGLTLKSMTEREVRIGGRIDGVEFLR